MSETANRILDDAWDLVSSTLRLLPNGWLRARMHRALLNEFSSLQAKAHCMSERKPFTPWSFDSVAGQRHEEWIWTLLEEIDESVQAGAGAERVRYQVCTVSTVLIGARRILRNADHALQAWFEQGEAPGAWLEIVNRHEAVYSTPNLPAFECSLVDDRIIAGRNPLTERDAAWLTAIGVSHVLDLREDWEWAEPRFGAEAVHCIDSKRTPVSVKDMQAPSNADLDAVVAFLTEHARAPRNLVYIHCRAGQERTAAVLCAYVARRDRLSYDDALVMLKQRRPSLQPLPVQERAVRAWLNNKRPHP